MAFCLTCDAEKHPVQKFTGKGMVEACPTCEAVFSRLDDEPPPVAAPRAASPAPKPKTGEPESGDSLVEKLRARLAFVEDEIAARVKYDAERDMLRRMLAIADPVIAEVVAPLN
jgi:hypothetical protein